MDAARLLTVPGTAPHSQELEMMPTVSAVVLRNAGVVILRRGVVLEVPSWRILTMISHCFGWKCVVSFK